MNKVFMTSELHKIKAPIGSRRKSKRVGRGNASQKGTTAGRGMKGQTARSGGKSRSAIRAIRDAILKVPKIRGFKSLVAKKEVVTLHTLNKIVSEGDFVNPMYLKRKGVISRPQNGVKILATGKITKKIIIKSCLASKTAIEAIENAGGSLIF